MLGATGPVVGALDQTAPFLGENMGKLPSLCSLYEPWSILTIWLMVIPSIIRILIMVIINPYEPLDD
jgi:hypothetical protein